MEYFNEYDLFTENEKITFVDFVELPIKGTDKTKIWNKERDRLDNISEMYYGHPYGENIILMANSAYGCNQEDIPDGATIIIPYPFRDTVQSYMDLVKYRKTLYS